MCFTFCRCGLLLFYRHTNKDEKVTFIFPDMLVQSGEKPVTTEKPELLDEAAAKRKRRKVIGSNIDVAFVIMSYLFLR